MSDFSIHRGTDETLDLVLKDAAGQPINLTGIQNMWFTVKRRFSQVDADALMQKTLVSGIVVDNAAGGLAHVDIVPADTASLPAFAQTFHYDVKIKLGGRTEILTEGELTIDPTVTQAG